MKKLLIFGAVAVVLVAIANFGADYLTDSTKSTEMYKECVRKDSLNKEFENDLESAREFAMIELTKDLPKGEFICTDEYEFLKNRIRIGKKLYKYRGICPDKYSLFEVRKEDSLDWIPIYKESIKCHQFKTKFQVGNKLFTDFGTSNARAFIVPEGIEVTGDQILVTTNGVVIKSEFTSDSKRTLVISSAIIICIFILMIVTFITSEVDPEMTWCYVGITVIVLAFIVPPIVLSLI